MSRLAETSMPDLFATRSASSYPEGVPHDVCDMFEKIALELHGKGFAYYSARDITARMRWHHHVDSDNREFVINNNWSPALARWLMKKHPRLAGFFDTRKIKNDE